MLEYRITLARSAEKEIATLPVAMQTRVAQAIDKLASNPSLPDKITLKKLSQPQRFFSPQRTQRLFFLCELCPFVVQLWLRLMTRYV